MAVFIRRARKWHVVQAQAVVRNDIAAIGSNTEIRRLAGRHITIIHPDGNTVLPGVIDAHTHPAGSAQESGRCSLDHTPLDLRMTRVKVAACLKQNLA